MADKTLKSVLSRLYQADIPLKEDIVFALSVEEKAHKVELFAFADDVRKKHVGNGILLRGIVEFSNYCDNSCKYCGLNRTNMRLVRYTLTEKQILKAVEQISAARIQTVVLQSGEQADLDACRLAGIIREIKTRFDMAVTLSLGEKTFEDYEMWKEAGADRYLLKIETTNRQLYNELHPQMSLDNRLRCLKDLNLLGYQTGCGGIIGLPGQTVSDIADDILFFAKENFDMLGIGPLIPHPATALGDCPAGDIEMVLKTVAVTRIVTKNAHIPATTAVGSVNGSDYRRDALIAGANVLMPNFTPLPFRKLYEIYPGKRCVTETPGNCASCMDLTAPAIGRNIEYSRGDSLKRIANKCA